MSNELGTHHGKPVMGASVKITNAGDGLTKPLAAEPRVFEPGVLLPVLVWCKVENEDYKTVEIDGGGVIGYQVKLNFKAQEAIVLDHVEPSTLDAMFATQREKVAVWEIEQARLRDEAKGIHALPLDDVNDDETAMSEDEWQASAGREAPTPIGGRRRRKAAEGE